MTEAEIHTVAANCYRFAKLITPAVERRIIASMDAIAKSDIAKAKRAGVIPPASQPRKSIAGAIGGVKSAHRCHGWQANDWQEVIAAIDGGAVTAPAIGEVVGVSPSTVHQRARRMVKMGYIDFTGPANGQRRFSVTPEGRAWMAGAQ